MRTQFWLEHMAGDQQPVWGKRCVHRLPGRLALLSEPATLAAALATTLAATTVTVAATLRTALATTAAAAAFTLAATIAYVPSPTGCPRHLRLRVQRGAKRAATTDPPLSAPSIS